ncbi:MAG TPA: IPT/TIG domain-containing protein [Verrucomicrobiae bacterium]|jgi:uncharacterized repeat protein (TIGR01451 family)|nr:IPT/TIG domain-containing protein [Verrucomicrobiae bacterium]
MVEARTVTIFRRIFGTAAFLLFLVLAGSLPAQIITNVSPPLGGHGDFIRIFGNGFAPGNHRPNTLSIDFNGTLSTTSTNQVVSDSEIDITNVPAAATSGYIHVFFNGNEAVSPQPFVIVPTNMPYATNFSPLYGANNTTVTITGVHFISGGATNVTFNGVISKTVAGVTPVVNSDNSMNVTAPASLTSGPLVLISKLGATHNFSTANNSISTATNFFAAPAVTSFSPASGRPNTNIVVKGTNFIAASAVAFGAVGAAAFAVVDNNTINATVPLNASSAHIVVSAPSGTILSPASSPAIFKMLPTIFSFSPASGVANTVITVSGAGLNEKSPHPDVTVGGGAVVTFGTVSPNTLSFNVPATAASGPITITTTNGSISSSQVFYLPASISSLSPNAGPAGTIVKITGNNFTDASAVSFNGLPAISFVVTNNTTIGAIAPAGVTSGVISITTPFGTTNSTALFFAPPTITSFTPTHGLPGTNVLISGTSFTNATGVWFNGIAANSFTVINNTTLSAVVPGLATTGPITVAAPGGTNSSVGNFTIDSTDLGISLSAFPNPVFVGSNLLYTIVVTNVGPVPAMNVRLTNTLPASVTLKSATTSQGTLATGANPISGALGNLNNGSSATVTLTVVPTATGLITNIAFVGSDSLDPNLANNSVSVVTTVWPLPLLSITNLMSNDLLRVSWPAPLSGFTLQFKTDLSANVSWTNDPGSKVVNGTNVSVIETNIGSPRFFRLTN